MNHAKQVRSRRRTFRVLRRLSVAEARKRPGRVLVTLGTVALGAGALTTALSLGSSVQTAVDDGIKVEFTNVDVLQRSDQSSGEDSAGATGSVSTGIAPSYLKKIAALDGVETIGTTVRANAVAQAGDIARGISLETLNSNSIFVWQRWDEGRPPSSATEIGLTRTTLETLHISLGDLVAIGHPGVGRAQYRVVGVVDTRGSVEREGTTYGIVTPEVAERLAGIDGPNTVMVKAEPGASVPNVVDGINRVAPVGLPQSIQDVLSARRAIQLGQINAMSAVVAALAGVSSLVAAITSATTTGASLASRRRTWALARCVGAGRRHIAGLVAAEGLILGLAGAVLGVLGGLGIARAAFPLVGLVPGLPELRGEAFTVHTSAVLIPILVSVGLALLGAVIPAVLAARIPPSAALKASSSPVADPSALRAAVAAMAFVGGGAAALWAASEKQYTWLIAGVVVLLVGAGALLSPVLVWMARIGARRSRTASVRLGFRDVVRRPRAAAIEAVAVFLAVGMISLSWVALSSVQAATSARLNSANTPDLAVGSSVDGTVISDDTVTSLRKVKGVASVTTIPFGDQVDIKGNGVDGKVTLSIGTAAGSAAELGRALPDGFPVAQVRDDTVYVANSSFPPFYEKSAVTLVGPNGKVPGMKLVYVEGLGVPTLVTPRTLARVSKQTEQRLAWVRLDSGIDRAKVLDEITGIAVLDNQLPVAGPVVLDIRVATGLSTARAAAVAILAIAVLVAVIGAAATASLSISERTREHATLRALGLNRVGLGRLLGTRVLFVSLTAATLGVAVGGVLGVIASRVVLENLSLDPRIAVPVLPVAIVVAVSVLAVRIAALVPMERASYVPPSRALAQG